MTKNVFAGKRTVESVAYDMALALASRDPMVVTPNGLLQRIEALLPECRNLATSKLKQEQRYWVDKDDNGWD